MNDNLIIVSLHRSTLALALTFSALAAAQEADISHCADLESDAERLACFDAAVNIRPAKATPNGAPKEQTATPAAAESSSTAPSPSAPPAAPGDPSAAAAAAADPSPAASDAGEGAEYRFMTKEEKKAARRAKKEQAKASREYTAVVVNMRKRPHGQVVVTLDNGEVWSEQYASRGFLVRVGDTVTMKKSRFSSAYRLVDENGKGYEVTRLE